MPTPSFCPSCQATFPLDADVDGRASCPGCGALVAVTTSCDVFVSFASEDLARARSVVSAFTAVGVTCWLAPERVEVGESFIQEIDSALTNASVLVLLLSRFAVASPWVEMEVTVAKSNRCLILPLKIDKFEVPRSFRMLLSHHQWEETSGKSVDTSMERVIEKVRAELRRRAARPLAADPAPAESTTPIEAPVPEGVNPLVSPYVGPQPFSKRMADRFFGRQQEAEALLRLLARSRVTLVYAPSGAGKSSLLNTVITQSLEAQAFDVMLDARVGGALAGSVRAADIRNVFCYSALCGLATPALPHPQWRLRDGLCSMQRKPETRGRILIFDQFEELFTQYRERFEDREDFFADVVEALRDDPELRVVFAMRQEYLADIEPLAESLPGDLAMQRMVLKRLGPEGALEAITRPALRYATFAPGVAEAIVSQLNTIRIPGFDSVIIEKRGEFIEMVHLQIVCSHLWSRLPADITRIEERHVNEAAGEGQTFNEFVVNALNNFYDSTVAKVSDSAVTKAHGEYSRDLIRLGMMKFVTPAATRTMVPHSHNRVGRLPDWIIEQLENEHLIRFEQRGGQRWYELSHDRLAGPVGRQMDREVSALLFAADLLAKVHENVLLENDGSLNGYFGEHREVLIECSSFKDQAGLFPDEAEFVFRTSIRTGLDVRAWSRRVGKDFPAVRDAVLRDALSTGSAEVRRHAVTLLGTEPIDELTQGLVAVALNDEDESVRWCASLSLARLDRADLFAAVIAALDSVSTRGRASRALVRILIAAQTVVTAATFEQCFARMRPAHRATIRRGAWTQRLRENVAVLAFVFVPAATLAASAAAAFKWLPSVWNWSVTQATPSAPMGIFQGLTAGVIWAGLITVGIAMYHTVFGNEHNARSLIRPIGAIAAGAVSGVISSALVVFLVIGVFDATPLTTMGWLRDGPFLYDIFARTRFGWVDIITGTALGIGMALATNALRASPAWQDFLNRERTMAGLDDAVRAIRELAWIALPKFWPVPLMMLVGGVLAFTVPDLRPADGTKANAADLVKGLFGDGATQVIGAFWGIVGMSFGLVVMRSGFRIEPRDDRA